ncbi:hypothetical protein JMA_04710 [Jeotgalibacillus malaysiensis]|uniref:MEDS domain-containing protein n=1 Tax=Jeotgalibacillus malaysiensis TaxID=1508404 RepID=A0A0B5AMM3_9BACL|nr:MEDS domain-containing protein [Jeotgalibacillus malaysiensis]AJD89788.1 hypothetical protein JMA_04710 [Jeotgalibacillus malaysiensis]
MKHSLPDLIAAQRNVHVLYSYDERNTYFQTLMAYILDCISAKEIIILIENERNYRKVMTELKKMISNEETQYIHFINSFEFYFSSGNYHPPAITAYFEKEIEPYLDHQTFFRTWAHVEWNSTDVPHHLIHDLETRIDGAVNDIEFPLICAYKNVDMPTDLRKILLQTHPFVLSEAELVPEKASLSVTANSVTHE